MAQDIKQILWRRVAILATLVPLSILAGVPRETIVYPAIGIVAIVFLFWFTEMLPLKRFYNKATLAVVLLVILLAAGLVQASFPSPSPKSYLVIFLIANVAVSIDIYRLSQLVKVPVGLTIGLVSSLIIHIYALAR
jgi:hypothetical protein